MLQDLTLYSRNQVFSNLEAVSPHPCSTVLKFSEKNDTWDFFFCAFISEKRVREQR